MQLRSQRILHTFECFLSSLLRHLTLGHPSFVPCLPFMLIVVAPLCIRVLRSSIGSYERPLPAKRSCKARSPASHHVALNASVSVLISLGALKWIALSGTPDPAKWRTHRRA